MKWYDVKLITLQKMFSNDTAEIITDDNTTPYLTAMPGAATACLNYIATAVRHIDLSYTIEQDGSQKGIQRYDLKKLAPEFFSLEPSSIYFEDEEGNYGKAYNFAVEHTSILLIDGSLKGKWTVYYNAYPTEIKQDTTDDYELPLYPEAAVLLPWFMASQLYKDDDPSLSTVYWNEFVAMLEDARNTAKKVMNTGFDEFINTKGWY